MTQRAHYGIDAPGIVRTHLILGPVLALVTVAGFAWPQSNPIPVWLTIGATFFAALLIFGAVVLLRSSLVLTQRVRDRLVAALELKGHERVLDAGCGLGLALIACAKQLTTGKAIGIDLWAAKDLSNNKPDATRTNAAAEGVADRIEVDTGDITKLPYADASLDAIISMTVLHNIPSAEGRDQALRELVRVLKPGGVVEKLVVDGDLATHGAKVTTYAIEGGKVIAIDIKGKVLAHGQGSNAILVTDKGSTPLTNLRVRAKDGKALVQTGGEIIDRAGFSVE